MKFIVDECVGPSVARWLRLQGYDVFSVYDQARGVDDNFVLSKVIEQNRILVTSDKDFGDIVFRDKWKHKGIILFRLLDEKPKNKILKLEQLLKEYSKELVGNFVVVTENTVRMIKK